MKKIIYILFLIGFLSCNNDDNKKPLINKNEMATILYDLHITEAYVSQLTLSSTNTLDTLSYYKQLVFKKHNTSEVSFNKSMDYYSRHPDKLEKIYELIKNIIQEKDLHLPHIDENKNSNLHEKKEAIKTPLDSIQTFSKKKNL